LRQRDAVIAPPRMYDGPLFEQPWQADVLAIADVLRDRGLFSAGEWASALGAALREVADHGVPDTPETYYRCALAALEALLSRHAPEIAMAMPGRVSAWRSAYLNTPHGQPVELAAAGPEDRGTEAAP
jgi:nitrile hydratase accessory protein